MVDRVTVPDGRILRRVALHEIDEGVVKDFCPIEPWDHASESVLAIVAPIPPVERRRPPQTTLLDQEGRDAAR